MSEEIKLLEQQELIAREAARTAKTKLQAAIDKQTEARREPLKALVIRAHGCLCRWNHTDGCGWFYEIKDGTHNWESESHRRWLFKYERLIYDDKLPVEHINLIIESIERLKPLITTSVRLLRTGLEP